MGSFQGHAFAGSFSIIFALWWTVQMFNRHFISLRRRIPFRSTVTYPCTCLCGKLRQWPIEGLFKIVFTFLGGLIEIIAGISNGRLVFVGNGQHAAIYFFYGLSGLMDLLTYDRVSCIPEDTDYIISLQAVVIEGVLFYFHLHGRSDLDVHIHMLLVFTIFLNVLAICFEIRFRHSLLAALGRAYCFFLQGTWLWQIGFILYNPDPNAEKWKAYDHDEVMIATIYYAWHAAAVTLIMMAIGGSVAYFHKARTDFGKEEEEGKLINKPLHNGQPQHFVHSDIESDVEFQTLLTK